jgi:hypothetical protein
VGHHHSVIRAAPEGPHVQHQQEEAPANPESFALSVPTAAPVGLIQPFSVPVTGTVRRRLPAAFCADLDGAEAERGQIFRNHPESLSITHISDGTFALSESFVILFVTPIRGGVTDERGEGIQYIRLA